MKKARILCIPILMLFSVTISSAQTDFLAQARKLFDKGNCKGAQVYYDMAVKEGKKDVDLERQIKECGGKTPATTPPKSKPTPTTTTPKSQPTYDPTPPKTGTDLVFTVNGVSFTMKSIVGGTFWMGSQNYDPNGINYDEDTQFTIEHVHSVTLSSFYMGETEVTQALWEAVMGNNPSHFKGDDHPVESVSWNDVQEFILRLNQMTGKDFRLPTEAEWEYAARGGTSTALYNGENLVINYINDDEISPNLDALAWYPGNCGYPNIVTGPRPVKRKIPNAYGLYDMLGNVREWCQDWYDVGYYFKSPSVNPQGPSSSKPNDLGEVYRVTRGGCWRYIPICHRVSDRGGDDPDKRDDAIGFRLCLPCLPQ